MEKITIQSIRDDIKKIVAVMLNCRKSIKTYRRAIKNERVRQRELKKLVKHPGSYTVKDLRRNVEDCDKHVGLFEATIGREQEHIGRYQFIIEKLEAKICQLKTISQ